MIVVISSHPWEFRLSHVVTFLQCTWKLQLPPLRTWIMSPAMRWFSMLRWVPVNVAQRGRPPNLRERNEKRPVSWRDSMTLLIESNLDTLLLQEPTQTPKTAKDGRALLLEQHDPTEQHDMHEVALALDISWCFTQRVRQSVRWKLLRRRDCPQVSLALLERMSEKAIPKARPALPSKKTWQVAELYTYTSIMQIHSFSLHGISVDKVYRAGHLSAACFSLVIFPGCGEL